VKVESHVIIGAVTWWAFLRHAPAPVASVVTTTDPRLLALTYPVAMVGALLPDLDHPGSAIAHSSVLVRPFAWGAHLAFGHRGLLHSLLMVAVVGYVGVRLVGGVFGLALAWGYLWHLLADFLTVQGVPFFLPLWGGRLHLPLLAIRTGSFAEAIYLVAISVLAVLYGLGYIWH
jgi:inner membrane protein